MNAIKESIKILEGDTLALLHQLPAATIDVIIADPPYNPGKDYGNNHDLRGFDDYLQFSHAWLSVAKRLLRETGTIYCFMGVRFISYLLTFLIENWACTSIVG